LRILLTRPGLENQRLKPDAAIEIDDTSISRSKTFARYRLDLFGLSKFGEILPSSPSLPFGKIRISLIKQTDG
jgi:hypothetical protein